jgi:hypothetical protein
MYKRGQYESSVTQVALEGKWLPVMTDGSLLPRHPGEVFAVSLLKMVYF